MMRHAGPMTTKSPTQQRRQLANLGPIEQLRAGQMPRRLAQLLLGLALYGFSMGLVITAALGAFPWDVLTTGLVRHFPMSFGAMTIITSAVVLLIWIPLKQKPGLGTLANAVLVGIAADATLAIFETPEHLWAQIAFMLGGIVLNGMATAMYIGSQLGPGPRDGLMTGVARVSGKSIRLVRTSIEVTVVALGFALGGALGFGTLVYALAIGPLAQAMLPWFTVDLKIPARPAQDIRSKV